MLFGSKAAKENKANHAHCSMLVDIGSGSVAVGLSEGKTVLFSIRERFDRPERTEAKEIQLALATALHSVLAQAAKKSRELSIKISQVHCFYSSPWQVAKTKSISINTGKPFEITQKTFDDIFAHAEKDDRAFAGLKLVSQNILTVKVNGYETQSPFGHTVPSLEAAISMSFTSKDIISLVEDAVMRGVGHMKMFHHSFDLSAFLALRHFSLIPRDLILIHIHHRVTDLILAVQGQPREIVSFPQGLTSIMSGVARELHIDESIARSKISMYVEGKLQIEDENMTRSGLVTPMKAWIAPIEAFFSSLTAAHALVPKKIYILSDGDLWHICRDALAESDFSKFAFCGEGCDVEKIATEGNDTNIYLEALYCASV